MQLQIQIIIYILISLGSFGTHQQIVPNNPIANISTTWINNVDSNNFALTYPNMKAILVRPTPNPRMAYACGFFSNGFKDRYHFSVAILMINNLASFDANVVWSANRNKPVYKNATFQLTSDGNMVLSNAESELVWSMNIVGKYVAGMNLTESGNLVLFDVNNSVVWQSFDHPTDTLLPGQRLRPGQKLIGCVTKFSCRKGLYSYTDDKDKFFLYVGQELYYHHRRNNSHENGSLLQLGWDGHLRRFHLDVAWKWKYAATDVLEGELSDCQYPLVCGEYGICQNGQCSCPLKNNFKLTRARQPKRGCSHINALNCNASDLHSFVEVLQANYFTFETDIQNTDRDTCKKACLANCTCKAAMFRYGLNSSIGDCYLPTQIYSLIGINDDQASNYNLSIDLKVQTTPKRVISSRRNHVPLIIGLTSGALLVVVFVIFFILMLIQKQDEVEEENDLDSLPTVFTRFSYKDINIATRNFSVNIGEAGFGSVFQGSLRDGTRIAVKICHVDNSFLTHIRSIGNIHHVNLVRLIGYCDEKSRKLRGAPVGGPWPGAPSENQ